MASNKTKATDSEVKIRLSLIYDMIVKGMSRKYIVRYCAEKWGLASRQVDVYLKRVYAEIKTTYGDSYKKNILSKQLAQLDDLYVKNYTKKDYRECRVIIESKSKLLGLNEPEKLNLNTTFDITKLYKGNDNDRTTRP